MHSPLPLQESDLIFPSASTALKDALGGLKRANLSLKNRLRSIQQDADFVVRVADALALPLVANERCGSWYIPPERRAGSAYFKSTDGHFGQWGVSLRRLNLQVLEVVGREGGCIIVDSTRRGKSMPDALSKTVPIWVAVLNRVLFPAETASHALSTPADVVSESEHAQIEDRLHHCAASVRGLGLDLDELRACLRQTPMRVDWLRPDDDLAHASLGMERSNLIVLCTASNQTSNVTAATSNYVQGAADDPESWSLGLDAAVFWKHRTELLLADEDELPSLINSLVTEARQSSVVRATTLIKPTTKVWIGSNAASEELRDEYDGIVQCSSQPSAILKEHKKSNYVHLACSTGKKGSRELRLQLSKTEELFANIMPESRILVACETGRDLAVGVALVALCLAFRDDGAVKVSHEQVGSPISKDLIRQRLSWIMVSMPDASPSRATLQSANAYLMG